MTNRGLLHGLLASSLPLPGALLPALQSLFNPHNALGAFLLTRRGPFRGAFLASSLPLPGALLPALQSLFNPHHAFGALLPRLHAYLPRRPVLGLLLLPLGPLLLAA